MGVWRCGGVEVWRCGGVEVWRCGSGCSGDFAVDSLDAVSSLMAIGLGLVPLVG